MDTQRRISQQLPQRIQPFYVLPLMGNNVTPLLRRNTGREINLRPEYAQHKRHTNAVRQIYFSPPVQRSHQLLLQSEIVEQAVQQHQTHTRHPYKTGKFQWRRFFFYLLLFQFLNRNRF